MTVLKGSQSVRMDEAGAQTRLTACNDHRDRLRPVSARFVLRERTRPMHDATEDAFAPYDLTRPEHYRCFLVAHASALPRLELGVTGKGWDRWHPRLPRLVDDLAALSIPLPVSMLAPDISPVAAWGVQYVLEGSRLGGRLLAQTVPHGLPTRYLAPDPDMSARWQAFCVALDAHNRGDEWLDEVIDAATETFQTFRRAALALAGDLP